MAETVLLSHPLDASFTSSYSTSSTSSAGDAGDDEADEADGVEDVAGYLSNLPLSSSEYDSEVCDESGSEDEIEEEFRTREREEMRVVSDQALRASLNTLLSCAAAARKANDPAVGTMAQIRERERESPLERSVEGLRVVQGSGPPAGVAAPTVQTVGSNRASKAGTGTASSAGSRTSSSPANSVTGDQSKRRKKSKKRQEVDLVMVVSLAAGAVVVVAAVGFAAFMAGGWVRREIAQDSVEAVLKEEARRLGVRT